MPAIDVTAEYWLRVHAIAKERGLSEEQLKKLRSAQLLRSLAAKNEFTKAALEVARNINALKACLRENHAAYLQLGRLSEPQRDRIEAEIGDYVRACSTNIDRLQRLLAASPRGTSPSKAAGVPPPPTEALAAHRQGMVFILSERLAAATAAFDRMRSIRFQQLQSQEAGRRARRPAPRGAAGGADGDRTTAQLHELMRLPGGGADRLGVGGVGGQAQQLEVENQALQMELLSMSGQVATAERTVREIAALNQMFSSAVLQQSEQIGQLYEQAVAATQHISAGNVQLGKAVRVSASGRKWTLALLLAAALGLLLLDWWYS